MDRQKLLAATGMIAWSGLVVAAYFVVHKPFALQVAGHLINLVWTLILSAILFINGVSLGLVTIRRLVPEAPSDASLLAIACGIGLGELGLLGFILAATGASNSLILLTAQLLLLAWSKWKGILAGVFSLIKSFILQFQASFSILPLWMRWAAILAGTLTFLMTLLPPADAFDALLYHLTVPDLWLQDRGLRQYNIPHYWFPGLVEGMYAWGLGLGSEIVPHHIHFAYALCTVFLLWHWTRRLWDDLTAGWLLMLLISMPSLLLLASWAYTDHALIFFGVAMLYSLVYGREQNDPRWWTLSAIAAGMAMGVKYTSFVMPVTAVILLAIWNLHKKRELFVDILKFGSVCAVTALIWYVRNWIWMGNPIYPFLFGGRYWDAFRSAWFATPGTGLGWDIGALLLLPLTVTLGYQDINSIDADIGPLLLLALPVALWVLFRKKSDERSQSSTLTAISVFAFLSAAFWTYGYITTRDLWQTRLLLPALVPFVIPMAVGIRSLRELDTKALRLSFIVAILAAISIYTNLFDMGLHVIARNPLAVAAGIVTKESYLEKYQPGYAYALQAVSRTNRDAKVYSLFEPRSYGMTRRVQPDPILDNFSHDLYLYGNAESIINEWRQQGYTHVLLNRRAAGFVLESADEQMVFDETIAALRSISTSSDGTYELLEVPAGGP
jgi:hypothetical protein